MPVHRNPGDRYLLSAVNEVITGSALDCRHVASDGYLYWSTEGIGPDPLSASAVANFEVSHDLTAWMVVHTITATARLTGTAQIPGHFPYVRGNVTNVYIATATIYSGTGTITMHWSPRLV